MVQSGVVVVALSAPEGHQQESKETQSNSDTRQRGTRVLLDGQSLKRQSHLGRQTANTERENKTRKVEVKTCL